MRTPVFALLVAALVLAGRCTRCTFTCGDPPVVDSDNVVAYYTDLQGNPTSTPLPPGFYDFEVDTYSYGVFPFVVEVVP